MPVPSDLEGGERNNYALSRSTSPAPSSARFFLLCFFSRVALCFVAVLGYPFPRFLPLAALVRSRGRFEAVRYRRYAFSTGACRLQSLLRLASRRQTSRVRRLHRSCERSGRERGLFTRVPIVRGFLVPVPFVASRASLRASGLVSSGPLCGLLKYSCHSVP